MFHSHFFFFSKSRWNPLLVLKYLLNHILPKGCGFLSMATPNGNTCASYHTFRHCPWPITLSNVCSLNQCLGCTVDPSCLDFKRLQPILIETNEDCLSVGSCEPKALPHVSLSFFFCSILAFYRLCSLLP